jgi:hypothetical protein
MQQSCAFHFNVIQEPYLLLILLSIHFLRNMIAFNSIHPFHSILHIHPVDEERKNHIVR